jgi:hypothetical protein
MSNLQSIPFRTIEHDDVAMHAFGGFPYLVTKVTAGLHHLLLLPAVDEERLLEAARAQWAANRLPSCLCLDWDRSVFLQGDGVPSPADDVPYATLTLTGFIRPVPLEPGQPWPDDRADQLAQFIETEGFPALKALQFSLGSSMKKGREASIDELTALSGRGREGAPFGLFPCAMCGEFRGTCLDPSPRLRGLVVEVVCSCVNDTRCAACGEPFCQRQLESNLYDPEDDSIWHLSAMPVLEHRCAPY